MHVVAAIAVGVVAALHLGFLVLEMFLWRGPVGRRVFGLPPEVMSATVGLAANQGLYNGFLAAGLLWGLLAGPPGFGIEIFFLSCVIFAGAFGAATAKRSILWVQGLPGLVALCLVLLAGR